MLRFSGSPFLRLSVSPFLLVALLFLLPLSSSAQKASFEVRGYAKNLGIRASSLLTGEAYLLDISRLRTQGVFNAGQQFHAEVYLDTEMLLGSFLETPDYALSASFERTTLLDLEWTFEDSDEAVLRQRLFRAFGTLYLGQAQVTAGRQRIAWGTGFAWNPTDLLNPFNPAAIELGEKEGVDAVHAVVPFGAFSKIEGVVAPGRRRGQTSAALRGGTHVGEYDVTALAGYFREDWVVGGDFAGYVGTAGLRGEAAYTVRKDGANYLRAILNTDYNFPSGYYVFAELYYNGQGTRNKDRYDLGALISGEAFNVAKDYLAVSINKLITPLLGASVYSLVNLDDQSSLVGPSLTYSLAENLELAAATYLFVGSGGSEFGAQKNIYFASLQYYF